MAELLEIPLDLQLREAHQRIQAHWDKGHKFPEFLSPMFLRRFPTIMENQLSINWDTISGIYDKMPFFPITLIDTEILDDWAAHPPPCGRWNQRGSTLGMCSPWCATHCRPATRARLPLCSGRHLF